MKIKYLTLNLTLLLSYSTIAQNINYLKQLQGTWKYIDRGTIVLVNVEGHKWRNTVYFEEKGKANVYYVDTSYFKGDKYDIHFLESCPKNSDDTVKSVNDSTGLCFKKENNYYDVVFIKDTFSIRWTERFQNVFNYVRVRIKAIRKPKVVFYSSPNKPTKMYLLKNDVVEVLLEKDQWIKIRFYGKKIIEGWIKKQDCR